MGGPFRTKLDGSCRVVEVIVVKIPTSYKEGYLKGRSIDPELADNYVAHTTMGDPIADAATVELNCLERSESARLIQRGVEAEDPTTLSDVPPATRRFFESCAEVPDWVDYSSFLPGCRLFHRHTRLVLAGMVGGTLVEGFTTNIAKSFFLTGRLRDNGQRRLRQNNRHMLEIFMPGGLERMGDGWTHSIRVRLVHAKVRNLLEQSDEWDTEELGTPLSAAHVGFALAAFSARLLRHIKRLGASYSREERESFMAVWRYSGYLMGIPESILYDTEENALRLFEIGRVIEPPPDVESIVLASSLINSAPLFAGLTDAPERRKLANYIAQISRELIGDETADQLMYPKKTSRGALLKFRFANLVDAGMNFVNPTRAKYNNNLTTILGISAFDEDGISFKMPDHHHAEESSEW